MSQLLSAGKSLLAQNWNGLLDLVFPPYCGICGNRADSEDHLVCGRCWSHIEGLEAPYCSSCRNFVYNETACPYCREKNTMVFSLGPYEGSLQTIIHDLKFQNLRPLAKNLGVKLAELIMRCECEFKINCIIPVPLHSSIREIRGFNQAEEIGRAISDGLAVPMMAELLRVTRKTRQQARLSAEQRENNVRGAFAVNDPSEYLRGKAVLLVDDVTTTGATLRENVRVLDEAGAGEIIAAVASTAI